MRELGGQRGHGLGLAIGDLEQDQGRVGTTVGAVAPEQAPTHDLDDVILVEVPQGGLANGVHLAQNRARGTHRQGVGVCEGVRDGV